MILIKIISVAFFEPSDLARKQQLIVCFQLLMHILRLYNGSTETLGILRNSVGLELFPFSHQILQKVYLLESSRSPIQAMAPIDFSR